MQTLSYTYEKPQNNDKGDTFFPAMERNIQKLNDHVHDGVTSAFLSSASQAIASGSWAAAPIGGGVYRQLIALPAGLNYDTCEIWFKLSTGEYVLPTVERASASTYYVYTNNNALAYVAFYR